MSAYVSAVVLGASSSSNSCTGECLKSGPWGLAIILILCVACYFLFKSMSKHMKRVREEFPKDPPQKASGSTAPRAEVQPARPAEPTEKRDVPPAG